MGWSSCWLMLAAGRSGWILTSWFTTFRSRSIFADMLLEIADRTLRNQSLRQFRSINPWKNPFFSFYLFLYLLIINSKPLPKYHQLLTQFASHQPKLIWILPKFYFRIKLFQISQIDPPFTSPVRRVSVSSYPSRQCQILTHQCDPFCMLSTSIRIGKKVSHKVLSCVLQSLHRSWLPIELFFWDFSCNFSDKSSEWCLRDHEFGVSLKFFDCVQHFVLFEFFLVWNVFLLFLIVLFLSGTFVSLMRLWGLIFFVNCLSQDVWRRFPVRFSVFVIFHHLFFGLIPSCLSVHGSIWKLLSEG